MNNDFNDDIEIIDDVMEEPLTPSNIEDDIDIIEESETEKKLMETLNLAEILDPDIAVPKTDEVVEEKAVPKTKNDQKSIVFVAVLFGILILFVILLPYITSFFEK